jgi:hypothetical protein
MRPAVVVEDSMSCSASEKFNGFNQLSARTISVSFDFYGRETIDGGLGIATHQ